MSEPPPSDTELVDSSVRFASVIEKASKEPRVALDLETDNYFRYPEHVSLLQIAVPDQGYIIDPLAIDDVASLGVLLADERVEKVFHSADYDVRSLDREWGFRIRGLFDTSIAAAFVGATRLGLGAVLEEFLKETVNKSRKLQRADWSLRPLSGEALDYAAADVRHLLRLREVLGELLKQLGRSEWVGEESYRLASVRYTRPDPEVSFLSMKGSRVLDGRGLAVLKSLVEFREGEALRMGRPPFRIMPNGALLEIAATPDVELNGMKGLGRYGRPPLVRELRRAVERGRAAPPVIRTPARTREHRRPTRSERAAYDRRLKGLKEWRTSQGTSLGLDPALLWPVASLERLAVNPASIRDEMMSEEVRQWQREELGDSLRSSLKKLD